MGPPSFPRRENRPREGRAWLVRAAFTAPPCPVKEGPSRGRGPGLARRPGCGARPDLCHPPLQLFIGFGFPYEGPAPLEAIANGCVFLQSRFSPPHSSLNHEFFRGKPTSREVRVRGRGGAPCGSWQRETEVWGEGRGGPNGWVRELAGRGRSCRNPRPGQVFSQHPYAENFIGKPHVWTVDYNNSDEFEAAIKAIMRTQVRPGPSQDGPSPRTSRGPPPFLGKMPLSVDSDPQARAGRSDSLADMRRGGGGEPLCSEQPAPPYLAALGPELRTEQIGAPPVGSGLEHSGFLQRVRAGVCERVCAGGGEREEGRVKSHSPVLFWSLHCGKRPGQGNGPLHAPPPRPSYWPWLGRRDEQRQVPPPSAPGAFPAPCAWSAARGELVGLGAESEIMRLGASGATASQ